MKLQRLVFALALLSLIAVVGPMQSGRIAPVAALEETLILPDGPDQLPLVFVHGYNSDGGSWGTSAGPYWEALRDITPGSGGSNTPAVENYAVSYAATGQSPFANSDLGWAVLQTAREMGLPSPEEAAPGQEFNPYLSPDPIPYFLGNAVNLLNWIPRCEHYLPIPSGCHIPAVDFLAELSERKVVSNYNRNGEAKYHAEDLQDLFRSEFGGGRFKDHSQLNMITHSAGGIDTRALLALLNRSESQTEKERIANVMFTAPPFGGSTIAEVANIIYDEDIDNDTLLDPWLGSIVSNQLESPMGIVLTSFLQSTPDFGLTDSQISTIIDILSGAANATGLNLLASWTMDAASFIVRGNIAEAIWLIRPIISDLAGFPGTPKVDVDLRPSGAITNLRNWERNPFTKQFVTWGEGGFAYNLSPEIDEATNSNFGTLDDVTVPGYLKAFPDDNALTKVSARVLTTDAPGGWMVPFAGYDDLTHGELISDPLTAGENWIKTLTAPVTSLRLKGPVEVADRGNRYYVVSPEFTFEFLPRPRKFKDQFDREITIRPWARETFDGFGRPVAATLPEGSEPGDEGVQYRVVHYPGGGSPVFGDWKEVPVNLIGPGGTPYRSDELNFSDLISEYNLLEGTAFRLKWRSMNEDGGYEGIRSASFRIDGDAPVTTSVRVFDSANENNTSEITRRSPSVSGLKASRGELALSKKATFPFQELIVGQTETEWVVRQSNRIKILQIDFDSAGTIKYVWDDKSRLDTAPQILVNRDTFGQVLNLLAPGPHTLYYYTEDGLGNRTDTQSVSVLVDSQPPVAALNYQAEHPLGILVGPDTLLQFQAQDAGSTVASGFLTVPGHPQGGVGVGSAFTLGETNLAQTGASNGLVGSFVTLTSETTDDVGNNGSDSFEVLYDWTAPDLDLKSVGKSIKLADGTYRTTERNIDIRLTGGEGELIEWTAAQPGPRYTGGTAELVTGLRGEYSADVRLMDGLNIISFGTEDPVGNRVTTSVIVERVHELVTGAATRPIQLIARGAAGMAVSNDGSTFVFDSKQTDVIEGDTNGKGDVFSWQNGVVTRISTNADGDQPAGGESRKPTVSGDGRYAYFLSDATNLTSDTTSGVNFYVKDLVEGKIALITRDTSGNPVNMSAFSGNLAFQRSCATDNGRYVFFEDRFSSYVTGDTNGNFDVFVADLDPDADGDLFEGGYVIRRVSLGAGSSQGTGGSGSSSGSRRPSCSGDGLSFVFETNHTDLLPDDTNGNWDPVFARFKGINSAGTIDFTDISIAPMAVYPIGQTNFGEIHPNGGRSPSIDRTGQVATFETTANLGFDDTNREGVDPDVYYSVPTGNFSVRVPATIYPGSDDQSAATFGITASSISNWNLGTGVLERASFVGSKGGVVTTDRTDSSDDVPDLFVRARGIGWERVNWITEDIPSTQRVSNGGITADGRWAWWVTTERYPGVAVDQGSQVLYKRRVDSDNTGVVASIVGSAVTSEAGGSATVSVKLASQPTVPEVVVNIGSDDESEGRPSTAKLTFTSANWSTAQTVTIRGQNDAVVDGDFEYTVRFDPVSEDSLYNGTGGAILTLTNEDDESPDQTPTITRQPRSVTVTAGGTASFSVTSSGSASPTYQWSLDGKPIQGQTSATIRLINVQAELAGRYTVAVSNTTGRSATSTAATLTINPVKVSAADLSITYDPVPASAVAGKELAYGLTVKNSGPDAATSVTVRADVPDSLAFVSAVSDQGKCSESSGTITCEIGSLVVRGQAKITVLLATAKESEVAHSANVFGAEEDPNSSDNLVTSTTDITSVVPGETPTPEPTREPTPTLAAPKPTETTRATETPTLVEPTAAPTTEARIQDPTEIPTALPTEVTVQPTLAEATVVPVERPTEIPTPQPEATPEPERAEITPLPTDAAAPTETPPASTGCAAPTKDGPMGLDVGLLLMLVVGMVLWKKR